VRGALTQAGGFSNIQTDIGNRQVKFDYAKSETEMKAALDELSKTNEHIRDWSKKG
jgi:hypothetical protein